MCKRVYIIAGPTAVGKTALAIELATLLETEIISADARQCFKELSIGVARPSLEELSKIKHHFIASHSIQEPVNAAIFEQYALEKITKLFQQKESVVMVGGTGLYIKAFCEGLDSIPAIAPNIRVEINQAYQHNGLAWLQESIQTIDPLFWESTTEKENPQRLMRALEVKIGLGESILSFQNNSKQSRPFEIIKIGLELPRDQLNERINQRVLQMQEAGLEMEVKGLLPHFALNALQTVGYREWEAYFAGEIAKTTVIASIQQNTRKYAKRQMTWFKKDPAFTWFDANSAQASNLILS